MRFIHPYFFGLIYLLITIIGVNTTYRTIDYSIDKSVNLLHVLTIYGGNPMNEKVNNARSLENLEEFFKVLHGPDSIDGYQVIYSLPVKLVHTFKPGQLSHLKGILSAIRLSNHMYYGVCLQQSVPEKGKRGSAETSVAMPGLWFDLDVVGPHHKESRYPESNEIALDFVNNLPWKPTILVHSGNGYQLLFLFKKPWVFSNNEDRANAKHP